MSAQLHHHEPHDSRDHGRQQCGRQGGAVGDTNLVAVQREKAKDQNPDHQPGGHADGDALQRGARIGSVFHRQPEYGCSSDENQAHLLVSAPDKP
jgi:hypothetical protein